MKTLSIPCYNEGNQHPAGDPPPAGRLPGGGVSGHQRLLHRRQRGASAQNQAFLDLPVNLGIGGGIQCGYLYARANGYDVTVQMDGDGQHDQPACQPSSRRWPTEPLICASAAGLSPARDFRPALCGGWASAFWSGLIHLLCGRRVLDVTSGFRATNAAMTAYFADHYATDYPEPEAILAATLAGYRVGEAPVVMLKAGGKTGIVSSQAQHGQIRFLLSLIIDRLSIPCAARQKKEAPKMTMQFQGFMLLGAALLLILIFVLLKKGLMSVKYSLLWLFLAIVLVIFCGISLCGVRFAGSFGH